MPPPCPVSERKRSRLANPGISEETLQTSKTRPLFLSRGSLTRFPPKLGRISPHRRTQTEFKVAVWLFPSRIRFDPCGKMTRCSSERLLES
ncbi:hypothetical protein Q5P01_005853 [Channa striata]|uniref:Uncharacterized protein n=1 Tax=Channa striata TaxID=64152 RepID=A0AA88NIB4_CHASR|nr:hypothetical protein Q5P01_005853 [Channa striata]